MGYSVSHVKLEPSASMSLVMLLLMASWGIKIDERTGANWEEEEFELYIFSVKLAMKAKYLLVGRRNSCKLKYAL